MKIAVCLIVYNGSPYIGKWLQHYVNCPSVDYVRVAEGATRNMVTAMNLKHPHSTDETINDLHRYLNNPKVRFINTSTPYEEKVGQQNAYVDLLPDDTDYIWVADFDEFYHYSDIALIRGLLEKHEYTYVQFLMHHFWKDANTIGIGGNGWGYDTPVDRIFRYYPGAKFMDHRPIRMNDIKGRSVKEVKPLLVADNPVKCFHYSYITQKNVYEKMLYYTRTFNRDYINNWYNPVWLQWTHENRFEIESRYSIHPTVPGAKTKYVSLKHPIDISNL
jgi:hypothetical protein